MPQNVGPQNLLSHQVLLLVSAALVPILILLYRFTLRTQSRREGVPLEYGLFHLALNRKPGDSKSEPPSTEWLNMGYWRVSSLQTFDGSRVVTPLD
jgi:hypothetical protein